MRSLGCTVVCHSRTSVQAHKCSNNQALEQLSTARSVLRSDLVVTTTPGAGRHSSASHVQVLKRTGPSLARLLDLLSCVAKNPAPLRFVAESATSKVAGSAEKSCWFTAIAFLANISGRKSTHCFRKTSALWRKTAQCDSLLPRSCKNSLESRPFKHTSPTYCTYPAKPSKPSQPTDIKSHVIALQHV